MLVGLSGYLAGYNGSFEFKSGETYPPELNYTFMRLFNSAFGAVCVPMAYFTAKELNFKRPTVWLVTIMVLFENSYTTISRFILLDSMLLCFTFSTILCWSKFHRYQKDPFSPEWGFWLMMTGVSIGCVCSVKWVGFFCTAMVGLYTIEDLWNKFGDLKMPKVSRAFCSFKKLSPNDSRLNWQHTSVSVSSASLSFLWQCTCFPSSSISLCSRTADLVMLK